MAYVCEERIDSTCEREDKKDKKICTKKLSVLLVLVYLTCCMCPYCSVVDRAQQMDLLANLLRI